MGYVKIKYLRLGEEVEGIFISLEGGDSGPLSWALLSFSSCSVIRGLMLNLLSIVALNLQPPQESWFLYLLDALNHRGYSDAGKDDDHRGEQEGREREREGV